MSPKHQRSQQKCTFCLQTGLLHGQGYKITLEQHSFLGSDLNKRTKSEVEHKGVRVTQ